MQNFSQIGEVPWPRHFNITRILQSTTLKTLYRQRKRGVVVPSTGKQFKKNIFVILFQAVSSGLLDAEGVRSKVPGGSRKRAEVLKF